MTSIKNYVAEFLGTFALVFIGAGAVVINTLTNGSLGIIGVAFAHGLVLMSMIYALSHVSGALFNPAVTVAMFATRKINLQNTIFYIIAQLIGAAFAGLVLASIFNAIVAPNQLPSQILYGFPQNLPFEVGIAVEAILTFFLVLTIFGVAVDNKAPKGFHGLAIGLVLTFDILFGGLITGAAMNPARAFGPALASGFWDTQVIYWIGPIIGALIAAFIYEYLFLKEVKLGKK